MYKYSELRSQPTDQKHIGGVGQGRKSHIKTPLAIKEPRHGDLANAVADIVSAGSSLDPGTLRACPLFCGLPVRSAACRQQLEQASFWWDSARDSCMVLVRAIRHHHTQTSATFNDWPIATASTTGRKPIRSKYDKMKKPAGPCDLVLIRARTAPNASRARCIEPCSRGNPSEEKSRCSSLPATEEAANLSTTKK